MGHPPARNRISRHLSRALAVVDARRSARPGVAAGTLSLSIPPFQTHVHVGRREADQRRSFLVEPDGTRLPLLDPAASDRAWMVGRQVARMAQALLDRGHACHGNPCPGADLVSPPPAPA